VRTGRRVSIIGSGPAGLAAADQLNKMGHEVRKPLLIETMVWSQYSATAPGSTIVVCAAPT
jgi:2-polyprenyl-6-methoxyphenol hydroxylase-like FAD-dependent oxidoreductase